MAVELGVGYVNIVPSARGFSSSLGTQLAGPATAAGKDAGEKAGKGFSSGLSATLKAVAGLAIVAGVTKLFKDSFAEAQQSIKVGRQTDAVIKSTGGAANVTAKQVQNLSNALSKKAGIDDEVIQSGANMLLTFKNIRNESGKGNDIFNRTTKATVDLAAGMAAASGGSVDLKSASIQLGKALNDPVKGITALARVGVQFTQQQKDQIKTLVESGDVLGAQKIILKEVQSQFGGSAAANATASDKMKVAFGNLEESIGLVLIPIITKLADVLTPLFEFLADNQPVLIAVAAIIGGALVAAFTAWAISAASAAVATLAAAAPVLAIVAVIAVVVAAVIFLWTNWDQVWGWIRDHPAYAIIIAILAAPVAAFVLIVGGLKWLYDNWSNIWSAIQQVVQIAWDFISGIFNAIISSLGWVGAAAAVIRGAWDGMFDGIAAAWNGVSGVVGFIIDRLKDLVDIAKRAKDIIDGLGDNGGLIPGFPNLPIVPSFAAGGNFGPGWNLVGERGPELLHFGPGVSGTILNNTDTQAALGGQSGGVVFNGPVTIGDRNVIPQLEFYAAVSAAHP